MLHKIRSHFLKLVAEAAGANHPVRRFPGTMPLTLSRRHLGMVSNNDYVALEKSDGTRYMLLALAEYVLLIDRSTRFYVVDPNPAILTQGFQDPQENTVLDGELTFNKMTNQWDYLIYDVVVINGDLSVASRGFRERMQAAEIYVAGPRLWAPFCSGLLRLRIKDYYEKRDLRRLFSRISKDPQGHYMYINNDRRDGVLCNENDGVIFAPVRMPYQLKQCPALLKWKPPQLNSIDFLLQLEKTVDRRNNEPSVRPFIAYQGERGPIRLREVYFPSKLKRRWAAEFDTYNGSIVELAYDKMAGEWKYLRQREDKEDPNFSSTVIDTMETIAESVEKDELVRFIEKRSPPPPKNQADYVKFSDQNRVCCTFTNDYFDDTNHDYVITTPISLVLPPRLPTRSGGRKKSSNTNGEQAAEENTPKEGGEMRVPMAYIDDV